MKTKTSISWSICQGYSGIPAVNVLLPAAFLSTCILARGSWGWELRTTFGSYYSRLEHNLSILLGDHTETISYWVIPDCRSPPKRSQPWKSVLPNGGNIPRTIAWNSLKSFWIGVPDRIMRLSVESASNIFEVLLFADLSLWPAESLFRSGDYDLRLPCAPSSQITSPIGGLFQGQLLPVRMPRTKTYMQ